MHCSRATEQKKAIIDWGLPWFIMSVKRAWREHKVCTHQCVLYQQTGAALQSNPCMGRNLFFLLRRRFGTRPEKARRRFPILFSRPLAANKATRTEPAECEFLRRFALLGNVPSRPLTATENWFPCAGGTAAPSARRDIYLTTDSASARTNYI
jgi:hypothetical protein